MIFKGGGDIAGSNAPTADVNVNKIGGTVQSGANVIDIANEAVRVNVVATVGGGGSGTSSSFGAAFPASGTAAGFIDSLGKMAGVTLDSGGNLPISGTVIANAGSGTFAISGTVAVANFPATQPVSGTVAISNFPATQPVSGTVTANQGGAPWSEDVTDRAARLLGHVTVDSAPTTAVTNAGLTNIDVALSTRALESGGNLATIAGKDFSTETTLALIKAKTDNLDVLLSTRTKPADQQHVIIDSGSVTASQGGAPWSDNLTQVGGAAIALGQAVMASSLPVAIASDQASLPVTISTPLTISALVSDLPESYAPNSTQSLSISSEGRLRVTSVQGDVTQVWQHTFDNPWESIPSPWSMENLYV